jgi:nitrate reductase NapE component
MFLCSSVKDILAKKRGKYDEERIEIVKSTLHHNEIITFLTTLLPETFPLLSVVALIS